MAGIAHRGHSAPLCQSTSEPAAFRDSLLVSDYRPTVTKQVEVQVNGTVDPQSGMLNWVFTTLDPATGDYPKDALAGFLPPNDASGVNDRGCEEFVQHRVWETSIPCAGP